MPFSHTRAASASASANASASSDFANASASSAQTEAFIENDETYPDEDIVSPRTAEDVETTPAATPTKATMSQDAIDTQASIDKSLNELATLENQQNAIKSNISKLEDAQSDRNLVIAESLGAFGLIVLIAALVSKRRRKNTI